MGIYPQPNAWQCGPFALKHGLLALGVVAHERALTRASGATQTGADERALARAAGRWGCALPTVRRRSAARARASLVERLEARQPVLVCVEQWSHWATVVARDGDAFVVLDSREAGVFRVMTWGQLGPALAYHTRGGRLYDLHPLVPRRRPLAWGRFSARRAAYLQRASNRDLAYAWGGYLGSLLAVSRPASAQTELTVPLAGVIRREARAFGREWPAPSPELRRAVRRRLTHAGFVAETYDLQVAPDGESLALAALDALSGVSPPPSAMAG
jgi:hypothetical protein